MKLLTSTTRCFVTNSSSDVRLVVPVLNFKEVFYETVRKIFQMQNFTKFVKVHSV